MNDALVEVPEFPPGAKGILWENWPLDKVCKLGRGSANSNFDTCSGIMVLATSVYD